MSTLDLKLAQAIFEAVAELPHAARAAALAERCAGDAALRTFVERLLANAERGMGSFLETTVATRLLPGLTAPPPERIGPYTVIRKIGEGGMGVVYEARQEHPRRTVALKIVRPGLTAESLRRRFEFEAEVLGRLQHPGIAHIYEAGMTPDGVAFFAMEFVRGRPLNEHVRASGLDRREIMELMARICDAVQHAHQRGVIHRDLKPANILVGDEATQESANAPPASSASPAQGGLTGIATERRSDEATRRSAHIPFSPSPSVLSAERDLSRVSAADSRTRATSRVARWFRAGPAPASGSVASTLPRFVATPKILDFGVARLVETERAAPAHTEAGQLVGTLAYMSPEQIAGDSQALDTRTDVYSLGVILFELLTGRLPHDVRQCSLVEAARLIREVEAPRLFTRSGGGAFDRDIETIIAKTLEKEKERRYPSAAELAADIRRYLRDEPLQARPASAFYQLRKFARRHRGLVGGAAVALLALVCGLAASLTLYAQAAAASQRESEQRKRAQEESAAARAASAETSAVLAFVLDDMIGATAPERSGYRVTIVEALDAAVNRIGDRFADRPRSAVLLHDKIGEMYRQLGRPQQSLEQRERALQIARDTFGADSARTLEIELALCDALADGGRWDVVLARLRELLPRAAQAAGPEGRLTIAVSTALGDALQVLGNYTEAEPLLRRTYELAARVLPDDPLQFRTLNALNACLRATNREDVALRRIEYEGTRRAYGPAHPLTLVSVNNYAVCLLTAGDNEQAAALLQGALEVLEARLPPAHPIIGETYNNYASILNRLGRREESLGAQRKAAETLIQASGELDPGTQRARRGLVRAYVRLGRLADAETYLEDTIAARVQAGDPPDAADLQQARAELAWNYAEEGRDCAAAERWLVQVQPDGPQPLAPDDGISLFAGMARAWCLLRAGQPAAAAAQADEVRAALEQSPPAMRGMVSWLRSSHARLHRALAAASQPDSAPAQRDPAPAQPDSAPAQPTAP